VKYRPEINNLYKIPYQINTQIESWKGSYCGIRTSSCVLSECKRLIGFYSRKERYKIRIDFQEIKAGNSASCIDTVSLGKYSTRSHETFSSAIS